MRAWAWEGAMMRRRDDARAGRPRALERKPYGCDAPSEPREAAPTSPQCATARHNPVAQLARQWRGKRVAVGTATSALLSSRCVSKQQPRRRQSQLRLGAGQSNDRDRYASGCPLPATQARRPVQQRRDHQRSRKCRRRNRASICPAELHGRRRRAATRRRRCRTLRCTLHLP